MTQGSTEIVDDSAAAAVPVVVMSDLVPDGRALIPVQTGGRVVLAVHPQAGVEQLVEELNVHFQHAYAVGFPIPYTHPSETRDHPPV